MNKLTYSKVKDSGKIQFIDLREQVAYRKGHLKDSLNLVIKNYEKYADNFLDKNQLIVLIVDEDSTQLLDEFEEKFKTDNVQGYLMNEEIDQADKETSKSVSPKDFFENNEDYILLDVRHPDEITRPAPEKNLVNIPLEDLTNQLDQLDQSKEIYTLCGSGNRSTTAAAYLAANDFQPIVIEGGMKAVQEYENN